MKRLGPVIVFLLLMPANLCFAVASYQDVRSARSVSDAVLLDRHGEVVHELRVDLTERRFAWTALADISPALIAAAIRSEDKRFFCHHGADWTALAWAALGNLFGNSRRGASTITMQLASMLDENLRSRAGRRSIVQKWKQIDAAREMERSWNKDRILEVYLNLVTYRGELQGIAAASRGLFDKDPGGLDDGESAILAVLLRSPNALTEKVGERAAALAASLGSAIPAVQIEQLARERLSRPYAIRRQPDDAPFVARILLDEEKKKAASTLDARIQRFVAGALEQAVSSLSGQNVSDGAVLVVDNKNGDVLAYVGNSGRLSSAPFVDGIQARRQAGSTLKPFLYGLAIEQRILTAASLIEDAPLDMPTTRGVYRPENYDKKFRGAVTARNALASSMNIPAVKTLGLVGTDDFVRKLRLFGFTDLAEPEHYGPSLALGSADVTLWELVNAYRTVANGGIRGGMRLSLGEAAGPKHRALSREASFIISDILSDREARSETFSFESPLATRFWTAVKTGTSKDMRDNWCLGYSDRYTAGVWIGNFSGAPMWNVSGVSGAAPLWLEVMKYLHHDAPSRAPLVPTGISVRSVMFFDQSGAHEKREWFIPGTEQESVRITPTNVPQKIIYPARDMVIAVDPDIPSEFQKVYFESSSDAVWILDGVAIGSTLSASWSPVSGRHELSLLGPDGAVADRISFEVR